MAVKPFYASIQYNGYFLTYTVTTEGDQLTSVWDDDLDVVINLRGDHRLGWIEACEISYDAAFDYFEAHQAILLEDHNNG